MAPIIVLKSLMVGERVSPQIAPKNGVKQPPGGAKKFFPPVGSPSPPHWGRIFIRAPFFWRRSFPPPEPWPGEWCRKQTSHGPRRKKKPEKRVSPPFAPTSGALAPEGFFFLKPVGPPRFPKPGTSTLVIGPIPPTVFRGTLRFYGPFLGTGPSKTPPLVPPPTARGQAKTPLFNLFRRRKGPIGGAPPPRSGKKNFPTPPWEKKP